MKKPHYDLVIGLGMACSCSQALRYADRQFLSFPFDWVAPDTRDRRHLVHDLPARAQHIVDGFRDWLRFEDLRFVAPHETNGKDIYLNVRTGLIFNHDFPAGRSLRETFPEVAGKYQRRIDRLIGLIRKSRNVLLVRIERPDLSEVTPEADCIQAQQILTDGFPGISFSLLQLVCNPSILPTNRRQERINEKIIRIEFNYKSKAPGSASFQPDLRMLADVLSDLFSVDDYRTREEIRKHRNSTRRKKLTAAGCDTWFQYHLLRWQNAIFGNLPSFRGDILATFFRRKFDHVLPLGTNCEVAFRFFRRWGFVESSLFAWAQSFDLKTLTHALSNLESIMVGEAVFDSGSFMWRCENTGLYFHGKMKHTPGTPMPSPKIRAEDLRDLRGRIAYLKQKFLSIIAGDETVLFVHRLAKEDAQAKDLGARLATLEKTLSSLNAKNCTLLVICERADRPNMPVNTTWIFRSVRKFNPTKQVTNEKLGDRHGWNAIFAEFAPKIVLEQKHKFKFE